MNDYSSKIKSKESIDALKKINVSDYEFWDEQESLLPISGNIQTRYKESILDFRPEIIAIPSTYETLPDQSRLTRGVLRSIKEIWTGEIIFYETLTPIPQPNRIDKIDGELKLRLLSCYPNQKKVYDFRQHITGMMTFRGASIGCEYGEGYLTYQWDQKNQSFEYSPLISIIIRSDNLFLLDTAIDSLLDQSYENFEVIVVWYGDKHKPEISNLIVSQVINGPGPKSANLNFGLDHANGKFVAFLDQDDYWLPDHLTILLSGLDSGNEPDIIYGKYLKVYCEIKEEKVLINHKEECESIAFEPNKLILGNFIPIHTYICSAKLAKKIKFDTELDVYEDWDFLLRAELYGATFLHVPKIVCEYRIYPLPSEEFDVHKIHLRKGYFQSLEKVTEKFSSIISKEDIQSLLFKNTEKLKENLELVNQNKRNEVEVNYLRSRLKKLDAKISEIHQWSEILFSNNIESNPINILASRALINGPKISLILPVFNPDPKHLIEAITSVIQQTYPNWQLCIVNDCSNTKNTNELLKQIEEVYCSDKRIKIINNSTNQGIVISTNNGINIADHEWIGFIDHDDRIHIDALLLIIREIIKDTSIDAVYTDSRNIDSNGAPLYEQKKSDWAPETLLRFNYINHFTCIKKSIIDKIGGLTPNYDGVQDWKLWLDLSNIKNIKVFHLKFPAYDWRASKNSVAYDMNSKPYVTSAAQRLLENHLKSLDIKDYRTEISKRIGGFEHYWESQNKPLTVVIIIKKIPQHFLNLFEQLVQSNYPSLEIILVFHKITSYLTESNSFLNISKEYKNVKVMHDDQEFNWARLNNRSFKLINTPWILFLDQNINFSSKFDLFELTKYFSLNDKVSTIGAKIVAADSNNLDVYRDGIYLNENSIIESITDHSIDSYIGTPRNVSAVEGKCLLTSKEFYELAGGFDERFKNNFSDTDYCFHLRALGFRSLQASDVTLKDYMPINKIEINTNPDDKLITDQNLFNQKWCDHLTYNFCTHYDYLHVGTRILIPNEK